METIEISNIDEMLRLLPEQALHEIRDFTSYLVDRERRRKELVVRVLKAEQNPDTVICNTVEEAMQAIMS